LGCWIQSSRNKKILILQRRRQQLDILGELYSDLQGDGTARLEFTRKAYHLLPEIESPFILDIGCGQGIPTLELAKLSQGKIIGLDTSQSDLDQLSKKISEEGLSQQVQVINGSMLDMNFPNESFDVIWSEGSINIIGFERGLQEWRRFIKSSGFLVVHEMTWLRPDPPQEIIDRWRPVYPGIRTAPEYTTLISDHGYILIDHFLLPEDTWWRDYYGPLEARIANLRNKYLMDRQAQKQLDQEQAEVDLFKRYSHWYGSAFYLMQKIHKS
jgi:SAM-dependent methyltransferase